MPDATMHSLIFTAFAATEPLGQTVATARGEGGPKPKETEEERNSIARESS